MMKYAREKLTLRLRNHLTKLYDPIWLRNARSDSIV